MLEPEELLGVPTLHTVSILCSVLLCFLINQPGRTKNKTKKREAPREAEAKMHLAAAARGGRFRSSGENLEMAKSRHQREAGRRVARSECVEKFNKNT